MVFYGVFAFVLLSLSAAQDIQDPIDLLAASGLTTASVSNFNPSGAITIAANGFGSLPSPAFTLIKPLSASTPLKVTDQSVKAKIFQTLTTNHPDFSISMLGKFERFRPPQVDGGSVTSTIISIESGSTIYFRIDIVARFAPIITQLSRNEIDLVITWRGTNGNTEVTKYENIDEDDGDGVKLDQTQDWSYLHFAFIRDLPSTDLDSQRTRISFYHSCTGVNQRTAGSIFMTTPPSNADIYVMGIIKNSGDSTVSNSVYATVQDVFFRFTGYSFAEISVDYCQFCVRDCSNYIEIVENEQKRLESAAEEKSVELRDCLIQRLPPPPCIPGCQLDDGTRIGVGEEKVVSAQRTCRCIDNGQLRCLEERASCIDTDGVPYIDGQSMPSDDACQVCICNDGSKACQAHSGCSALKCSGEDYSASVDGECCPVCVVSYCRNFIDESRYSDKGVSCTEQPSCENPDGVGCSESETQKGCFCTGKEVIYTDRKTGSRRCVPRFDCPCRVGDTEYKGGDYFLKDGKFCYCSGGDEVCS